MTSPAPANLVIVIRVTTRAHSSGDENNGVSVFKTYEDASAYLMETFQSYLETDYPDVEDLFDDFGGEQAPEPTMALATELFSPAKLSEVKDYETTLYGPWSDYCALVPFEINMSVHRT
jgi:hypothetical protein